MEMLVRQYRRMSDLMRAEDVEILEQILLMGRKHAPEVSVAGVDAETGFMLSVLIEMMKLLPREEE